MTVSHWSHQVHGFQACPSRRPFSDISSHLHNNELVLRPNYRQGPAADEDRQLLRWHQHDLHIRQAVSEADR
jgi:hypothetical protein